jgi:hypothetical protein
MMKASLRGRYSGRGGNKPGKVRAQRGPMRGKSRK